jgi:hypothetical protein
MADGLLTQGLNYIDQQKQALAARLGLLANNPQEFSRQLLTETEQRMGKGLLGEPKTAQEMATGNWVNTPYGKQAIQAFSIAAPIAYHGTPYLFDKFDMSKVGTGEGAQAYSHGMYFAEKPGIASEYQKNLSAGYANKVARGEIKNPEYRKAQADLLRYERDLLKKYQFEGISPLVEVMYHGESKFPKEVVEKIKQLSGREEEIYNKLSKGYLYKVDIPDKAANTFLDWDKEIKSQPYVLNKIRSMISDPDILKSFDYNVSKGMTGANAYKNWVPGKTQAEISTNLNNIGVYGTKYLDATSRSVGEGSKNYVVYNPERFVDILERNNQPVQGLLK